MKDHRNVSIDFIPEVNRYAIIDNETDEIIRSYKTEADAMFDYASLRNGEETIEDIKNR